MRAYNLSLRILPLLALPAIAVCEEGFSSAEPSIPANIYYRAFTIYTLQEACEKSPVVSRLNLHIPDPSISVGDRIRTNEPDDSMVSDLVIEAFDSDGNFLPSVPVFVGAGSVGSTQDFDPGIIYRDASMNYWEARKPGAFEIGASWACAESEETTAISRVIIQVQNK